MSLHVSINDAEMHFHFNGTISASSNGPSASTSSSSMENIFTNYSKNELPFSSLLRHVTQERRMAIQEEIENEILKEIQALKGESSSSAKPSSSGRRQQVAERNDKIVHQLFEREMNKYNKIENDYWEVLQTPFPPEFQMIEAYKRKEKTVEFELQNQMMRLNEIFRRKLLFDATREPSVKVTASRKITKIYKARR